MALKPVSAVYDAAVQKALDAADAAGRPDPSDAELRAIGDEAARKDVYGHDYKKDAKGNPIPQGSGAPGHENINHFNSIRRYEGELAYEKACREIYKRDPQRAAALGLPEPTRIGG